eukprot:403354387
MKNYLVSIWNRKQIEEQNERYLEQIRSLNDKKISLKNSTNQSNDSQDGEMFRPEVIIQRIDYHKEVKSEEDYQRKQKLQNMIFTVKMKLQAFYYGLNVQTMANNLGQFLKLYHESLQGLVQGYRETTMDAKGEFKFEDGASVQDKLDKYENKLYEYSTGFTKEILKKKDEKLEEYRQKQKHEELNK